MANEIRTGTVLVKHDALLPVELKFESEPCVEGWALVKNLPDGDGIERSKRMGGPPFVSVGRFEVASLGLTDKRWSGGWSGDF